MCQEKRSTGAPDFSPEVVLYLGIRIHGYLVSESLTVIIH
jgi:hypothetical protein